MSQKSNDSEKPNITDEGYGSWSNLTRTISGEKQAG